MGSKIILRDFIELFVCKNTVVRLWTPHKCGHKMIVNSSGREVCMEWELLKGSVEQSKYNNCTVRGVTDILCETYREAVNIVIEI